MTMNADDRRLTPGEDPEFTFNRMPTERPLRSPDFFWASRYDLPNLVCERMLREIDARFGSVRPSGEAMVQNAKSLIHAALAESNMGGVRGLEVIRCAAETRVRRAGALRLDAHAAARGAIEGASEAAASILVVEDDAAAAGVVAAASRMDASEADRLLDGAAGAEARVNHGFRVDSKNRTFNGTGNRPTAH